MVLVIYYLEIYGVQYMFLSATKYSSLVCIWCYNLVCFRSFWYKATLFELITRSIPARVYHQDREKDAIMHRQWSFCPYHIKAVGGTALPSLYIFSFPLQIVCGWLTKWSLVDWRGWWLMRRQAAWEYTARNVAALQFCTEHSCQCI